MNEFRDRKTGNLVYEPDLRAAHTNISLPQVLNADACNVLGVDPVLPSPAPAVTSTQLVLRNGITQDTNGNWIWAWTVKDMSSAERADALTNAQAAKSATVAESCKDQIYQGFDSSALGTSYHYPAQDRDQMNLTACVTASQNPALPTGWTIRFYCADANAVWEKRPHTAAQIQQVGQDGVNAIQTCLDKNDSLQQQIYAVGTEPAWAASTAYALNAVIQDNGYRYTCTTAGTSAATAPTFPTAANGTITDGTVVWTCDGTLLDAVNAVNW